MGPKWQKLASLALEVCTLWFQFFGAVFASKGYLLRTYLTSLQLVAGTVVVAVERLPALHYSVDFIFLSFGIIGFIVEL